MEERFQYPIGKFSAQENYTFEETQQNINRIEQVASKIEALANQLSDTQLNTPYREGGWTARQVIHHIADSHMNAFIRFKWTLTESTPTIKAYDEKAWAMTPEVQADVALSVALIRALHAKWVVLLRALTPDDLKKAFMHPETGKLNPLARTIALYAWHGEHHLGHLNIVKEKK